MRSRQLRKQLTAPNPQPRSRPMVKAGSSNITINLARATAADRAAVWRKAVAQARAAERDPKRTDETLAAAAQAVTATAQAIWKAGPRHWSDCVLYAEMA